MRKANITSCSKYSAKAKPTYENSSGGASIRLRRISFPLNPNLPGCAWYTHSNSSVFSVSSVAENKKPTATKLWWAKVTYAKASVT
jgi:hypothetical protein